MTYIFIYNICGIGNNIPELRSSNPADEITLNKLLVILTKHLVIIISVIKYSSRSNQWRTPRSMPFGETVFLNRPRPSWSCYSKKVNMGR